MKTLKISKPPDTAIREILLFLLEKKKVGGVFTLSRIDAGGYAYTLITDKELLDDVAPTFPLMPANAGKMVSRLTMIEPAGLPVAVIIRPCELRALFELVKLDQAKLDNLLFISFTCGGVFPIKTMQDELEPKLEEYWDRIKTGEIPEELRESCRICENFIPNNADIILVLIGKDNNTESSIMINTEKGEEFLAELNNRFVEENIESEELEITRNKRRELRKEIFDDLPTESFGIEGSIKIFGRCINCHACSKACPICYCNLCHFESSESESCPSTFETELNKRGALRLPADTVFYHLGRLIHVGISCVGCGMCSDVCPTNIPVSTIFSKVAEHVQDLFNYLPGRNIEEKIPISTFETKELEDLGE